MHLDLRSTKVYSQGKSELAHAMLEKTLLLLHSLASH